MKQLDPFCGLKGDLDHSYNQMSKQLNTKLTKEEVNYVSNLPIENSWKIKAFSIKCVHGSPRMSNEKIDSSTDIDELMRIVEYVEEDVIFCGHSSEAFQCEIDQKRIINVVSITASKDNNYGTYFILSIEDDLNIQQKHLDF